MQPWSLFQAPALHFLQKNQNFKAFSPSKAKSKSNCPRQSFKKASERQTLGKWVFISEKSK